MRHPVLASPLGVANLAVAWRLMHGYSDDMMAKLLAHGWPPSGGVTVASVTPVD